MECKNCQTDLVKTASYCINCGAKIIRHRLNFKTITQEFFATFISWDNTFFKTAKHLVIKPEVVITEYLRGVRKKYMQPFAFLIIILTIYGIYLYFARDFITESMEELFVQQKQDFSNKPTGKFGLAYDEFNKIYYNAMMNHPNLFSFIFIPISAVISLLIFREKRYNFIEHNIIFTYANAIYSLIATIIGWVGFVVFNEVRISSTVTMIVLFTYYTFVFKRVFSLSIFKTIYKSLLFYGLTFVLFSILLVALFAYVFMTL